MSLYNLNRFSLFHFPLWLQVDIDGQEFNLLDFSKINHTEKETSYIATFVNGTGLWIFVHFTVYKTSLWLLER